MLRKKHIGGTKLPYSFRAAQNVKQVSDSSQVSLFEKTTDYGFGSFFREHYPKASRVKYKQYNRAVFIDIRKMVESLSLENSDLTSSLTYFRNTITEVINDICYDYAVNNDFDERAYETLIAVMQEHYRDYLIATPMSRNTGSYNVHWFRKILGDRFSVTEGTLPPAMYNEPLEEAENASDFGEQYTTTHNKAVLSALNDMVSVNKWRKMPLGVVGIMLPTDYFIGYLLSKWLTDGSHASAYGQSNMFYSAHPENKNYYITSEGYYWYYSQRSGMYYDIVTGSWIAKSQTTNRRKYARCAQCRELYSVKFLDWYKTRSYSNNRSRICFNCIAMYTTSYNPHHKAWVWATEDGNMDNARYDVPAIYKHIDDTDETATGVRDYSFIQQDNGAGDQPVLPVETRRYMAHLRNLEIKNKMLNYRFWLAFARNGQMQRDRAMYDNPDNRTVINNIPVEVFNRDGERTIRIWTDHLGATRDFSWRNASRRREQRVDDGWLDVNSGMALNLARNNYSYKPEFYYVTNLDGKWVATHTAANNRQVMDCQYCAEAEGHSGSHVNCSHWHKQYGLFMGLELELIVRDNRDMFENLGYQQIFERTIQTFHPQNYADNCEDIIPQLLYAKYDGSLPSNSGVEYISQPMSLQAWQNVPSLFWHTVNETYKAFSVGGVGIHIHIPWAAFTELQAYVFLSLLQALQDNSNGLLRKVAQRASNSWTAWDELEYSNVPNTIAQVVKSREAENSSKYQGINLLHDNTIELRYFNSNAKGGRVIKNLEFVHMLYDYALEMTDGFVWDANEDEIPPSDIVQQVEEFRHVISNCPQEYTDMIVNDIDEHVMVLQAEWELVSFLRGNKDKYPHLYGYLTDTHDGSIELVQSELDAVYPDEAESDEEVEQPTVTLREDW